MGKFWRAFSRALAKIDSCLRTEYPTANAAGKLRFRTALTLAECLELHDDILFKSFFGQESTLSALHKIKRCKANKQGGASARMHMQIASLPHWCLCTLLTTVQRQLLTCMSMLVTSTRTVLVATQLSINAVTYRLTCSTLKSTQICCFKHKLHWRPHVAHGVQI